MLCPQSFGEALTRFPPPPLHTEKWTLLARQAVAGAQETAQGIELELSRTLLDLLAADPDGTTRAHEYLDSALNRDVRLVRPVVVAHALLGNPATSVSTWESAFASITAFGQHDSGTFLFAGAGHSELVEAVEASRRQLLPVIRANPDTTLASQRWLVWLVQHTARSTLQLPSSSSVRNCCLTELRGLREELPGINAERLAHLERDLAALIDRSTPRRRRRQSATSNLEDVGRADRSIGPDAALFAASLLLDPYIPPRTLEERLQGLLRYRCDQATFRGSTSPEGAALLLEEILGALIWSLHSATTHALVFESLVFAKTLDVLQDALRRLRATIVGAESRVNASSGLSLQDAYDQFVTSFCQQGTLPPSEGSELAFEAEPASLQPLAVEDWEQKLASADQATFSTLLQENAHSFGSQAKFAVELAREYKKRADTFDLGVLAFLCEVLVAHTDELAVILLHVAPQDLLGPVRHVLDKVAASRDDSSDSITIERCGTLIHFLQIVTHRFKLWDDLDRHLGSSTSVLSTWLRRPSDTFTLAHLAESERNVVGGWISALFGEGISDDLIHSTNPMTLFKVAPTILKQSVMACRVGVVDVESLRDAMSYFLQELLRYSLPGVIEWLINEVVRTPEPKAQQPLLEVLRIFCLSESLPPSVLELVSSEVVELVVSTHAFSTAERLQVLKTMVPFTPTRNPVAWAADPPRPAVTTTTDDDQQAGRTRFPFILTERDRLAALISSDSLAGVSALEAYLSTHHAHGTAALPSEATCAYGRLERAAAALTAANELALSHLVLEASHTVVGDGLAITPDRAAFVGNVLGGALTIIGTPARARHLRVLARAHEATKSGASAPGNASGSAVVTDRLLSWPVIAAYPGLSPVAET